MMKVKVAKHAQLEWRIHFPRWLGFENSNGVYEMYYDFHSQEGKQESDTIKQIPIWSDALRGMSLL